MLPTALGIIAATWAIVMALAPLLQIREILRCRNSSGLSVAYLLVLIVGFVLWVAYGTATGDLPLIVPNTLAAIVMSVTVLIALRYR